MNPYSEVILKARKIGIDIYRNFTPFTSWTIYRNFTPFTSWIKELKDKETVRCDIIAGITVALILIPQSMAYAQLAGLKPHYGLYAAFLPVAVAAFFGSSRQLATGPVAVVSLLTASALQPLVTNNPEMYIVYAIMLALMVGIIQLVLGLLRLGIMVDFLSHPVVFGFTNAAAIIIATSQLGKVLGIEVDKEAFHFETVWNTLLVSDMTHLLSLGFALGSLAMMLLIRKFAPRLPDILLAVIVATLISWYFDFKEEWGGAVVGEIPMGLPGFEAPSFDLESARQLFSAALAISLIGFMEAISIAKVMAGRTRQRLDANQELIGQGLSNCVASMFQSYPVSGSFSRSAVNIESMARTGFSSIVTAIVVGITLLFLTPLFYHLPQPTLAAVIILAVVNLLKIRPFRQIWRIQKHDALIAGSTFILTLIYAPHLENGIIVGVLLSLGLYVYRTMRPKISMLARHSDGGLRDASRQILTTCPKVTILQFGGPLFFANTGYFENKVLERIASKPELRFIIVDSVSINEIDATGEQMLHKLSRTLVESNIEFLFARVPAEVMETLKRSGFASEEWADHFFLTRQEALSFAWRQLRKNHDTECSIESCKTFDLSSCVLRRRRRVANPFLKTVAAGLEKTKRPDMPS